LSGYKPKILKTKVIPNNPKIPNKVVIPPTFKETSSTNKGKKVSNGVTLGKGRGFNF
jgi:hypothetical protein